MITIVLLIAFVVGVGGILFVWGPSLIRTQTSVVETQEVLKCAYALVNVKYAYQNCSHRFFAIVSNDGSVELKNLIALVFDVNDNIINLNVYNGTFSPGSALSISGYVPTLGLLKKIEVYSPTCPGYRGSKDFTGYAPDGMAFISALGGFCVDKYEASRSDATASSPGSSSVASSRQGVIPWVSLNQTQARQACEAAGKHLCTNAEWQAATGTSASDTSCTKGNNYYGTDSTDPSVNCTADGKGDPTQPGRCLTGSESVWCNFLGVCDLNGNVWEWVNETWFTSEPGNTSTVICWNTNSESDVNKPNHICLAGWDVRGGNNGNYVNSWNWTYNYPIKGSSNAAFGNDYFWTWCGGNATGYDCEGAGGNPYGGLGANSQTIYQRAALRGGNWGNGAYAGCFAMSLNYAPSYSHLGMGFRCCL